jgi:site-specific DNA-methyltransferase (adenine-specific)
MVINGDGLTEMKKMDNESIGLVYLDPPFFTQCRQTLKDKNLNEHSFDDQWAGIEAYKSFMKERLSECQRILKKTGSIFLHCDRYASHHLRIILDEVFGARNFQSEIIWSYRRWSNAKKGLLNAHQVIFFYSKTDKFTFNPIYNGYSEATNIDQIFQKRKRDANGKTVYRTSELGNYELIEEKKGVPLSDVWEIPYLNPKAKERVGYPTQKPILLLERIVEIASNPGDTILDPFCGSGTTLVAAKLLGRKYLGIDTSPDAVALSEKRLENPIRSDSTLLKKGRLAYSNQNTEILSLLNQIEAEPVQRNRGIDGFLKVNGKMIPVPIRIQRKDETIESAKQQLSKAIQKNGFKRAALYQTNDKTEMPLFTLSISNTPNDQLYVYNTIDAIIRNKSVLTYER